MNAKPLSLESCAIFSYEELKQKAQREIDRLIEAEKKMNTIDAMDAALNAAFTIYHLLEWQDKTQNPASDKSANSILKEMNNIFLNTLHDLVTRQKHMIVGSKKITATPEINRQDNRSFLVTMDGRSLTDEAGASLVTTGSKIVIYFDDEVAVNVLNAALQTFA